MHNHLLPPKALSALEESGLLARTAEDSPAILSGRGPGTALAADLIDVDLQREHLDACGFTRASIMVPPFATLYGLPPDVTLRYARAFNDGAAEVSARDSRFFGLATVPLQDPLASAAEARRAVNDLGFKGIGIISRAGDLELASPKMDAFWEEVERLRVPVFIHPDVQMPVGSERMRAHHLRNLVGNPSETAFVAASLVFSGMLDRFPGVTFVLSHGGGTFPYIIGRLEHGYQVRPECRAQQGSPSAYLRRFYYDSVVFEPATLRYLVGIAGADRIVAGTDWPFDMADPDPAGIVSRAGLDPHTAAQILGGTAAALLGFES
jgi:aminocarboxymuconate-semialdehyde decarboxylase